MRKSFILCIMALFLFKSSSFSQEYMFKALFMYNFTKYIEWPAAYKQGDFIIAVVGSSGMAAELEKIASKKTVVSQKIIVQKHNDISSVGKAHMVYIPTSQSGQLNATLSKMSGKPTVIVTDKPGLASIGAGINYVTISGKQKFEINTGNIRACGLKVNSNLLNLGIEVN